MLTFSYKIINFANSPPLLKDQLLKYETRNLKYDLRNKDQIIECGSKTSSGERTFKPSNKRDGIDLSNTSVLSQKENEALNDLPNDADQIDVSDVVRKLFPEKSDETSDYCHKKSPLLRNVQSIKLFEMWNLMKVNIDQIPKKK
ncbi:unnamed protein product [Brachionus calyciflorus]|uniref:Uncharacterized protein n=1 Tax=Brachionus calyciflorus TaxID=104777 RepID=A0A814KZF7_9BILA|nr:unnamed protein product [Brachionus calyciflorus]